MSQNAASAWPTRHTPGPRPDGLDGGSFTAGGAHGNGVRRAYIWSERAHIPRALGVPIGLVLGLGALIGLVAALAPVFSHEVNRFAASLPALIDSLRHKLGSLTGTSPTKIGTQLQQFVNGCTRHPSRLLGPIASVATTVAGRWWPLSSSS